MNDWEPGDPDEPRDYEVGRGKPPKEHRFKPGQSGNPRGRPKRRPNLMTLLGSELAKKIVITEGGKQKKAMKMEAIVKRACNEGMTKSIKPLLEFYSLAQKIQNDEIAKENHDEKHTPIHIRVVGVRPGEPDDEDDY